MLLVEGYWGLCDRSKMLEERNPQRGDSQLAPDASTRRHPLIVSPFPKRRGPEPPRAALGGRLLVILYLYLCLCPGPLLAGVEA